MEGTYSISIDPGNWGGKAVAEDREVVIQNVVVPYDGGDEELRLLNVFSGDAEGASFEAGDPVTESARVGFQSQDGMHYWLVGAAAEQQMIRSYQQTTYSRYGTDEWYALIGALFVKLYPKRAGNIGLTLSMPVSQIKAGRVAEITDMVAGLWQLEYEGRERNYEVQADAIDVIPEGFGSLVYLCISPSGKSIVDRVLAESRIVVFDFGGYTLDVMTFRALGKGPFNESIDSGLIHVRNTVEREIRRKFNRGRMTAGDLDKVIRSGHYRHAGSEPVDVNDIVQDAVVGLVKDALRIWREDLNSGADYDTVMITGGGGPVIGPLLAAQLAHNDVRIIPAGEAHVANVRGGLRYRNFKRQYAMK
jgi:actin-like protein